MLTELLRRITGRSEPAEPRTRMASIYRRKGKTYVTASSRTRDGFWLEEGPVDMFDAGDPAIAEAALSALARSRHGIAAPKDWSSRANRVVAAAGLKRFSAFAKGTALVSVEEKGGEIRIMPHRNGGSGKGYLGLEDKAIDLPSGTSSLAEAIETAFQRCS